MTEETSRQAWQRMQGDEATALEAQQRAAGSTHSPVLGPGPYGDHGTNLSVETAVAQETARCAALVVAWSRDQPPATQDLLLRLAAAMQDARPPAP